MARSIPAKSEWQKVQVSAFDINDREILKAQRFERLAAQKTVRTPTAPTVKTPTEIEVAEPLSIERLRNRLRYL